VELKSCRARERGPQLAVEPYPISLTDTVDCVVILSVCVSYHLLY